MDFDLSFNKEKREVLNLYFLKPEELKIDKNAINFHDIANISKSRITCFNASMCIRSEKVTRAQYLKAVKKL